MLEHTPSFNASDAARIAWEHYGRRGQARQLTSERDQNFLIEADNGDAIVLKIANALAQRHVAVPRVICTTRGDALTEIADCVGTRHLAWAVSYLPGVQLADVPHRSVALLEELGREIGRLTAALQNVAHPRLERAFHWDLTHAAERVAGSRSAITDDAFGAAIDRTLALVRERVVPRERALARSVIHND